MKCFAPTEGEADTRQQPVTTLNCLHIFSHTCRMPSGKASLTEEVESTCFFPCTEIISVVEFSPYANTSKLIAYGGDSRICIGSCTFDNENLQNIQFDHKVDILHGARVNAISWSPQSSIDQYPGLLR